MTNSIRLRSKSLNHRLAGCIIVIIVASTVTQASAQTQISRIQNLLSSFSIKRLGGFKASFTFSPRYPVEGQAVQFVNFSSGDSTSWAWDFGDGSTSREKNPIHTYTNAGFRKVTLVVTNSATSKRATRTLMVMPSPEPASFVFNPTTPGPGQDVQFADTTPGNPTSWQWGFGDGTTSTVKNPVHAFRKEGSFDVTLVAKTKSWSKRAARTIHVTNITVLTASFNYSPASPAVGQTVQFTDTSIGIPTAWSWNFGDGSVSTVQNPSHTYMAVGPKIVTLTVTNTSGSNSTSRTMMVGAALEAAFTFSPASPAVGQTVQFTDTSIGIPTAWSWNFGDGSVSTVQNPSHPYTAVGSYSVVLSVTNASGSNTTSQNITIATSSLISASFSFYPAAPEVGQSIQFTDTSTGDPTSWEWDFGDGSFSTLQNPIHPFAEAATYTVTLAARNNTNSDITTETINVVPPSELIPADRRIDWSPGIRGGIPTYPVAINVKNAPYNAKGDGVADDTSALKLAIANCPDRSAIYIPAGTYRLRDQIEIFMKSIVLRGDGPDRTFLKFETSGEDGIVISGEGGAYFTRAVSSGYTKGSTSIVVGNTTGIHEGDYLLISQNNDPEVCENMQGYQVRSIGQIVKVVEIAGNTIALNRPLYYNYNPAYAPQIVKYAMAEMAGVEDLHISDSSIFFYIAANCWLNNVESFRTEGSAHVTFQRGYANVVRSSYFHHAIEYGGGAGYGVFLLDRCTDNLIEDNIFYYLRHAATIEWGGCGNVIAYNYATTFFDESEPYTNWLMQSIHTHGGHPYMNLFEGNVCPSIVFDNAIGSSRHNTAFRNHSYRFGDNAEGSITANLNAIEVQKNNLYENVIGNVLCCPGDTGAYEVNSSGRGVYKLGCNQSNCSDYDPRVKETLLRHGNYDYITDMTHWDPAIAEQNLPNSLYLTSKPEFFGDLPWPMIGPDLSPMVGHLPAKSRFETKFFSQTSR